jgi:membrane protein
VARGSSGRRRASGRGGRLRRDVALLRELRDVDWRSAVVAFRRHQLPTHASAIAFRVLVSLVPLALLGLALLALLGLEDVWTQTLAPAVRERVSGPVFQAIDYSVRRIFREGSLGVLAFSALLLLWELYRAVRAITVALNVIHDVEEKRSWRRRLATALVLAVAVGSVLVASVLVVTTLPRAAGDGLERLVATAGAWLLALALLGLAAGLLIRFAPAERPQARWASAGSFVVVTTWALASLAFGWWAFSVASYESAVGSLTVFLFLTFYVLVSSAIFLFGAQLDELAREAASDDD